MPVPVQANPFPAQANPFPAQAPLSLALVPTLFSDIVSEKEDIVLY